MAECNLAYSYPASKEKYCKFSYSSWCTTCERSSPRRRSRSESLEPCRRKCKEMKTLTPKKYLNKSTEYENMELELDYKNWHDAKYDCCRIRPNLVELPTSYISNNCQTSKNDVKNVKCYDDSIKFVDFKGNLQNFDSMQENGKYGSKLDSFKPCYQIHRPEMYFKSKSTNEFTENQNKDNQDFQNANTSRYGNCREFCTLVDLKHHNGMDRRPLCYNTTTYFNRQYDSSNFEEKYTREVEYLREKLRILKNGAFSNKESSSLVDREDIKVNGTDSVKPNFIVPIVVKSEAKPKVIRREKVILSPPLVKSARSKISVKTKRINSAKIKKSKSKLVNVSASDASQSDYSGSESDVVEDSDDPDSVTEDSTRGSSDSALAVNSFFKGSGDTTVGWPVRHSLFPNIPPYVKFNSHELDIAYKLPSGRKYFKWKLSTITPVIVRKTLMNSGFVLVRSEFSRESNTWLGTWGKHMKSPMFKTLKENQKLNHFPGTFQLGRKDRLWRNFQRMISKFGIAEFGFLPHTYVLPQEIRMLKQNWEFRTGLGKEKWIIKPPACARGVGIKVINKWSQLPKKTSIVVQKYISNPYLINGSKFDLRLYVLVTSFHPLRIYLYPEGLARFASAKYSDDDKDLQDRYMHLTNYSINKLSSQYTANEDANACQGHKWTISKLMEYLNKDGVDTKSLWKNLQDLVIKTIITAEPLITPLCEENMISHYNCYELFGVDVLLDEYLKPWLLEVNISPSLHSASPLDAHVKGPLVQTLFDMAQFHFPQRLSQNVKQSPVCFEPKMYSVNLTKKETHKHKNFEQFERREDYLFDILRELTGDDVRHLIRSEDEFVVKGKFEKIFPTASSYKYLQYMESRYYNKLFDAWETKYSGRREDGIVLLRLLCAQKVHLKVAPQSTLSKSLPSTIHMVQEAKVVPSTEGQSRPLEDIMKEATITNKVSTTNG